jgi:hypothetical protein
VVERDDPELCVVRAGCSAVVRAAAVRGVRKKISDVAGISNDRVPAQVGVFL